MTGPGRAGLTRSCHGTRDATLGPAGRGPAAAPWSVSGTNAAGGSPCSAEHATLQTEVFRVNTI